MSKYKKQRAGITSSNLATEISTSGVTGDLTITGAVTIADEGAIVLILKDTNGAGDAAQMQISFRDSADVPQAKIETQSGSDDLLIKSITGSIELFANDTVKLLIDDNGQTTVHGNNSSAVKLRIGQSGQSDDAYFGAFDKSGGAYRSLGWDDTVDGWIAEDAAGSLKTIVTDGNLVAQIEAAGSLVIADVGTTVLTIKDTNGAGNAASVAIEFTDSGDVEQAIIKTSASNNDLQIRSTTGAVRLYANDTLKFEVQDAGKCLISGADATVVKVQLGDTSTTGDTMIAFRDVDAANFRDLGWDNGDSVFKAEDSTGTASPIVVSDSEIKIKKLTGTTGGTEGNTTNMAHALTFTKILAVDVLVTDGTNLISPQYTDVAEKEYAVIIDATNVILDLATTNSGSILSKAITVLVTYEA